MNKPQFDSVTRWQRETFTEATPSSKCHHLIEEVQELLTEAEKYPFENRAALGKELADCFILLMGVADASGFSYREVCQEIQNKMIINKSRQWGSPTRTELLNT
jgi:NTP pyrophosphatase (non-canonical NTP hydrolase)